MTGNRICKKNCPLYKHRMLGHGMGESKCVVMGSNIPLYKKCLVDEKTYQKRINEEIKKQGYDEW